jgi:cytochrome d ubiquinol oxidase subunit II
MPDAAAIVAFFLVASLVLYAVLGGADYGAGIIEWLGPRHRGAEQQRLVAHALGPVWEANHVWLIIALVILMMGYPAAFQAIAITFHIPLTLLLICITLRGTAFTFRSYDAFKEPRGQALYTLVFEASSYLAPVVLGVIAGGLILGRVPADAALPLDASADFHARFVAPWLNWFCLSVGVFLMALFAFVAAVFLCGEAADAGDRELHALYRRRALAANALAVVAGLAVFGAASVSGLDLVERFAAEPRALASMALATVLLAPLHLVLRTDAPSIVARILAGAVFTCVFFGWYALQAPTIVATTAPPGLTLLNSAAPDATMTWLAGALLAGSVLMLPALGYLLYVFKFKAESQPE